MSGVSAPYGYTSSTRAILLFRGVSLGIILLDLALVGGQMALYPALLIQPGGLIYLLEPIVLLIVYGAIMGAVTWANTPTRCATLPSRICGRR